jgi:tetratricopeptide (TPR) repeat protein
MNEPVAAMFHPGQIGVLVALVNQGRLGEAEQEALRLLRLHPEVGMLWKILSVALLRQGKDAIPALLKAADLMPQDAEVHGNLAAALYDRGRWALALASWSRVLGLQPTNGEALIGSADSLRALGRPAESLAMYQRALKINPGDLEARNNLGNAYLELGRADDAIDCYRGALELGRDNAQIHCNLSRALLLSGRNDEALAMSRTAVELDPKSAVTHDNHGLVLARLGRREEARAAYGRALNLNPTHVDALDHLGGLLRDLGQRREAVTLYRKAIELDPQRADIHCHLGHVLFELRHVEGAAASYRHALLLRPDLVSAHVSLAAVLRHQRRPEDAEASCRAALDIDPTDVESLSLLGELRADRGQFGAAEALFQQAIKVNPNFASAYAGIATHRKMTTDDVSWLQGAESLLTKPTSLTDQIGLHYAMGKYFDDTGQFDHAFGHYREANELTKRYGSVYEPTKFTGLVDEIIANFDAENFARNREYGSASELPVFIIGMPRSGTSLSEQILASHPSVFGAGEVAFWDKAFAEHQKAAAGAGARLMPAMVRDYLARLAAAAGAASRVVDKMPANFLYAGLIHAALPQARIIHMRRHPIDTCLSIYFQNFFNIGPYANDLDHLAHYYGQYLRITDHWRAVLPTANLLEVSYEGLIEDQEGWSRRMVEFIGLPWDSQCLDFHRAERSVITASKWQVRQKIHSASAGRWRNYEKHIGPLRALESAAETPLDRAVP